MAGRTVVTVKTDDRQQEAYDILQRYNAYDWSSRSGQAADYAGTSANAYTQTSQNPQAGYTNATTDTTDTTDTNAITAYDTTTDQGAHKVPLVPPFSCILRP